MNCCPTCGQTLPPLDNLGLRGQQRRIYEIVAKAGKHGVPTDVLVNRLFEDRDDGGPLYARNVMQVQLHRLNERLRTIGKVVCCDKGGEGARGDYKLVAIQTSC